MYHIIVTLCIYLFGVLLILFVKRFETLCIMRLTNVIYYYYYYYYKQTRYTTQPVWLHLEIELFSRQDHLQSQHYCTELSLPHDSYLVTQALLQ